jgi:hypothetical protein
MAADRTPRVRVRVHPACGHDWTETRPPGMVPPADGELRVCGHPDCYPATYPVTYTRPAERSRDWYQRITRLCTTCVTWTCAACGWQRHNTRPGAALPCRRCGSPDGTAVGTRHNQARWEAHNPGLNWDEARL